jgi:hypothetical protein
MPPNRNGVTGLDLAVARELRAEIARQKDTSVLGIAAALQMRRSTLSVRMNGHVPFSNSLLAAVAAQLGLKASEVVARAEAALAAEAVAS